MPKGQPRHPIVRSIDEGLKSARQEIRRLEAARAELRKPTAAERAATRIQKRSSSKRQFAELDASIATRHQPTGV